MEKLIIFTPLQKLPNNVGNFGKIIVPTKVQKIAQSGHTGRCRGVDKPNLTL